MFFFCVFLFFLFFLSLFLITTIVNIGINALTKICNKISICTLLVKYIDDSELGIKFKTTKSDSFNIKRKRLTAVKIRTKIHENLSFESISVIFYYKF